MDTIGRCVASDHFQVAERALFLWNNEQLVKNGILNQAHASAVLPMMYPFLAKNKRGHWNSTVDELTENVLNMYRDYDATTYAHCEASHETRLVELEQADVYRKETWGTMDA